MNRSSRIKAQNVWNQQEKSLHILFVTYSARIRECKLYHAAKLCGHQVTLITHKKSVPGNLEDYIDKYYIVSNPWQCLRIIEDLKPDVVHLFVCYTNAQLLPVLWFSPAPVVYDPYDCIKGMFMPGHGPFWLEQNAEKWCFARADHICSRSLESRYLRRQFNYQMPTATYFPDYCWSKPLDVKQILISDGQEFHLVSCGGVIPEYIDVGRILAKQKIHMHIYPVPALKKDQYEYAFARYIEESTDNAYFHFHETLPYSQLMEEIAMYDAAILEFPLIMNKRYSRSQFKTYFASSNKIFDYIEAGLPIVVPNKGTHQGRLAQRYGYAVPISNINETREALIAYYKKAGSSNAGSVSIAFQARRLGKMYESISVKDA